MLFGEAEEATVNPGPAARKLKVPLEMPLMLTDAVPPQLVVATFPVELTVRQLLPDVPRAVMARLVVVAWPLMVVDAKDASPPDWVREASITVEELKVEVLLNAVLPLKTEDEAKVEVFAKVMAPLKVCVAVQVTLEAEVT